MNYYIYQNEMIYWRNHLIQADMRDYGIEVGRGKSRRYIEMPDFSPHWWDALPITPPLPHLAFKVHPKAPLPDDLFTGTIFELYSKRLISILAQFEIRFETFPATLVNYKTNGKLPLEYEVFHLLELADVIDQEKSVIHRKGVDKLVLIEGVEKSGMRFARIKGREYLMIIHQSVKQILDTHRITGCRCTPVEKYREVVSGIHTDKKINDV